MFFRAAWIARGACIASALAFGLVAKAAPPELAVYAYDSFLAQGGLGEAIVPEFEKRCACKVRWIGVGDGAQLINRLELEAKRGKPAGQIVLGLDPLTWERAKPWLESWGGWKPRGCSQLVPEARAAVREGEGAGFLPFDYAPLAFMQDTQAEPRLALHSVRDLVESRFRRRFILEDPRTSTPGLQFLLYTRTILGDGFTSFWRALRAQWLTLAPGWGNAYGLFTHEQAPLVWSYVTSQAYHDRNATQTRFRAVLFAEGQPLQVEGAALVRGGNRTSADLARARDFLEYLISEAAQRAIPGRNWMLPARSGVALPPSFRALPAARAIRLPALGAGEIALILREWEAIVN